MSLQPKLLSPHKTRQISIVSCMAKRFKKIYLEVSNICNLQCDFCPEVIRPKQIMNSNDFRRSIDQIAPLADEICLHLMGDPLTHPKLADFIDYCGQMSLPVNLTTNGLLITPEKKNLLLNPAIRQVNFSLQSFYANYPDKDIGSYLKLIFDFTSEAFVKRPDLYINYRLWNLNKTDLQPLENEFIFSSVESYFKILIDRQINVRRQKSKKIINKLYFHFDSRFDWPDINQPILGTKGRCHGLGTHIGIHADGTVVPCCLDKEANINLGNINKNTLAQILDSKRALAIKSGFDNHLLEEELCQKCSYIRRFSKNYSS